ncbi:MAG: CoA transferase, partial [Myxococcota bacterium]
MGVPLHEETGSRRPVVLSVEQALAMPYATLRFVHLGWRVIRVEATPVEGRKSKGDPNRTIGRPVAGDDRHSYYVAPNAGKEALAINLKEQEGRDLLRRMIRALPVDVFCTNSLPIRHRPFGIDYETLCRERDDLIWCSISAMGTEEPTVPGYDPVLQALCGYMDLTGDRDGPPMQCGPPIIDLKAGDEVFAQVMLAMWERSQTGRGKMIDISMARGAVSWLQTFMPMLEMGSPPEEIRRNGNEHRQFIPVNAYPTADGFIFVAVGSDAQWARLVEPGMFASLKQDRFASNEERRANKEDLHRLIGKITATHTRGDVAEALAKAAVPHAPISGIEEVGKLPFVARAALSTKRPDGRPIAL